MRILADLVVLFHFAFIAFVIAGGVLVLRWPQLAWLHLPAVAWGATVEFFGWICPLTPIENRLRAAAGLTTYDGDFVARYVLPVIYPAGLTREVQMALGAFILALNAIAYYYVFKKSRS